VWHHSSSPSVAGSGASPGSAPSSRSRSIPGPNRLGVSGCDGPKSYVAERGPKTSSGWVGTGGTIAAMERVYTAPLLDKLGIRPGMRVAIVGDLDADPEAPVIRASIRERTTDVTNGRPQPDTDVVLLLVESTDELAILSELRLRIRQAGAIWVVSRKGKAATIRDIEVMSLARDHGLIDNKVVAFSAERTSIRLVIPVALRQQA
jgi:hypothetical protein